MTSREHRIREVAHHLWEQEGRPHDQEKRHWELAEQMVAEEEQASAPPESSGTAKASRPRRTKSPTPAKRKTRA